MRLVILALSLFIFTNAQAGQPTAETTSGNALIEPMVRESKLLGKPLRIEQQAEVLPSGLGVVTSTQTELLEHAGTLIEASVQAIPTDGASTSEAANTNSSIPGASASPSPSGLQLARTDLYIGGTRIWTGSLRYQKGSLVYSGGVAPTQIPFPVFAYPLGPLMLRVDAGIEFEGELVASLTPGLSYPLPDSSLDASLKAELGASGFIEGYASIWLVRGGVGGRVDLIEGATGVTGHLYLNGMKPSGQGLGQVRLLSGAVYGFVDTKLFFGRWNRILHKDFFKWDGWCYSFGASACTAQ